MNAKSCSRCGNRRRTEDFPKGHMLIPTYWDPDRPVCLQCAGELAQLHDKEGWPEVPAELVPSTAVRNGTSAKDLETPATPKEKAIAISDEKARKVPTRGGPVPFIACYKAIDRCVSFPDGRYEYDGTHYVWHWEAR